MTADLSDPAMPASSDDLTDAVTAYLSGYKGLPREHTHSDLRVFLTWCAGHGFDPLTVARHQLELYVRWLQEVRRYKPSTVSRRTARHADPRTTMRYDRARKNLDRHANYIVAAYMAAST